MEGGQSAVGQSYGMTEEMEGGGGGLRGQKRIRRSGGEKGGVQRRKERPQERQDGWKV